MKTQRLQMVSLFFGVIALALLGNGSLSYGQMGTLDGKIFSGEIGKKGRKTGGKDDLVFKEGKFRSTACDKFGFTEAPYTVKASGRDTIFEAEAVSAKEGTMKWTGTVKGNTATATVLWSKPDKPPTELWYKGKLTK